MRYFSAGLLVYTISRFRRRRADDDKPPQVYGSTQIALAWTVIPLLTVLVLFLVTARTIKAVQDAVPSPENEADGDHGETPTVLGCCIMRRIARQYTA